MRWKNLGQLPNDFPQRLSRSAQDLSSIGSFELAWSYPEVLEVIKELAARNYAILGGEVLLEGDHGLTFLGDNWYVGQREGISWHDYVLQSANVALNYIETFHLRIKRGAWFVPTFAQEASTNTVEGAD